jgi:hypothetical protein
LGHINYATQWLNHAVLSDWHIARLAHLRQLPLFAYDHYTVVIVTCMYMR